MDMSKLQICIKILCVLSSKVPTNLVWLKTKVELDEECLKSHIRLLWNIGLIEEETFGDCQSYYVVTEKGLKVLAIISPIIKEAHRIRIHEFQKISSMLSRTGIQ